MKNKDKYRISTPNGIDEKIFVPINGQLQYIFIRGKNINNPIILHLHGGPANPDSFLTYEFAKEIIDDFTFVSWDQRGCGRTYYKNKKMDAENETVTFEQAINDVNELVNYLCERFDKKKIIVMGHSYGTILGVNYVYTHPQKVEKYIGIGQSVSIMDTQTKNYDEIIKMIAHDKQKSHKITSAYNELKKNYTIENLSRFQRISLSFLAEKKDIKQANQLKLIFNSPDLSWKDCRWLLGMAKIKKHISRNKKLLDYTLSSNIYDVGNVFSVPMFFISGEYDKHCNANLVEEYCERITAPLKEAVVIKNHGHSPQIVEPIAFAKVVVNYNGSKEKAEEIVQYFVAKNIDTIDVLCGISLGGKIAHEIWKSGKLKIDHLIMDGAPLVACPKFAINIMIKNYKDIIHKSKVRDAKVIENFKKYFLPEKYLDSYLKIADLMTDTSIENIVNSVFAGGKTEGVHNQSRILFIHGTKGNEVLSKKAAKLMKKFYPITEVVCFKGDTHCYKAIYQPEKWISVVKDFLNGGKK